MVCATMLRFLGKNTACVRLHDTGAVISVQLPTDCEPGVQGYKRLTQVSPWSPCTVQLELAEYNQDRHSFACSKFELEKSSVDLSTTTTKYRRIRMPVI